MPTRSHRVMRRGRAVSVVLGALLVGVAATPAHADTVRERQWHLDAMQAEEMWKTSTGKGVTVAVIDTGVDDTLADLHGQVLPGLNLSSEQGDEHTDWKGHGTGMASLIAGTGKRSAADGAFGLAPGVKVLPVRLPKDTEGSKFVNLPMWLEKLSQGIRYAADHGAKVINISQASPEGSDELTSAVKYALGKGSLVFAGVGNSGDKGNPIQYPGATPGVVGVAAVDKKIEATKESQHGPQVDLAAPGDEMTEACGGGTQICTSHGTSDATALASASAALIWSAHPQWTNNQVLRVLLNTAGGPKNGDKRSDYIGYGVVRPRIALKTPGDPGPANEWPLPDLAAAGTPSPQASASPAPSAAGKPVTAAPDSESDDGGNTGLWVGVGAAGVVVAAVAVLLVRSRRRTS
ncbi:type VII secretion-associated serine protease mycosin [Streptomyces sp. ERV7]|uniref:type VII secretion-associated serine protease mycosin n=1 Tax=Streptomyces sp. ERV7 TaxID=1322334 RepID=UPI0007F33BCF|nr:type VII secretion-associated serine protease mycosin [Streptomyces sp. ERV7]OAR26030.1 type VII secretion-associated serine protease mycosin [Streptomyces sp. ERV7]